MASSLSAPPPPQPTSNSNLTKNPAAVGRELLQQKENFLMFARVLLRYLQIKDPALHQQAKATIKDCAERNKRQERGYESMTSSMKTRLKEVVGEQYWGRAEEYFKYLIKKSKTDAAKQAITNLSPPLLSATTLTSKSYHPTLPPFITTCQENDSNKNFFMFAKMLVSYLDMKDPVLGESAEYTINDCKDCHKRQEQGYESLEASTKVRLKEIVGVQYWKEAEEYFRNQNNFKENC